jgi:glycosyltransferase involved in cell wall biosynthesis
LVCRDIFTTEHALILQSNSQQNILISAYACNPKHGSEEAVGWNWAQMIARSHRVTVLTAKHQEPDIRAVCDPGGNPRFVFVPHQPWHYTPTPIWRAIENSIAKPIMNFAYLAWLRDAYVLARKLAARERFDLAHQLTYVGFRFPGHLWKLGLPFVWGPVGGLENTAWGLLPVMGFGGAIYYGGRNLINSAQRRWLRSPRLAAAAAGPGLIAATHAIARELKALYGVDSTVISEVVAPLELSPASAPARRPGESLRVVWSGLHLPGKALNLLLEALGRLPRHRSLEVHIVGDGPMRPAWRALAVRLGVEQRCVWHGQLSRPEALKIMSSGHVLAITSLKDLTSTVLLEGLALGLAVICPDHCGFSGVVTDSCGIKIPAPSGKALIEGMAEGLLRLEGDEAGRREMGRGALARAREFGPEALQTKLEAVYMHTLAGACPAVTPPATGRVVA